MKEIPWLAPDAVKFIESIVTLEHKIFEYGSGGSTVWFSKKVQIVYTVEHNKKWADQINKKDLCNVKLFYRKLNRCGRYNSQYCSKWDQYVNTIDQFPDGYFDMILVDGRLRRRCMLSSLQKVKSDGWIVLDDSQRSRYDCIVKSVDNRERYDFYEQTSKEIRRTTLWKI